MNAKSVLRRQILERRRQQSQRDVLSGIICQQLQELNAWSRAHQVLFYIDVRDEVRTTPLLRQELTGNKICSVPYCRGATLELVRIERWEELSPGKFGIREPGVEWQQSPARRVDPTTIDLAVIPGVAFDRQGGRLGHGRGYYDRLLEQVRPDCLRIGLAFDCQVVDHVPSQSHDVKMHLVITESGIFNTASGLRLSR